MTDTSECKINKLLSLRYLQGEGVPQGGVLSVTLFALKINGIASQINNDPRYHRSLYVDDFQLAYHHSDLDILKSKIQTAHTEKPGGKLDIKKRFHILCSKNKSNAFYNNSRPTSASGALYVR